MENPKITIGHGTFEDIELPPMLYKYRTWSDQWHKRFITEREVFFASPKTFEDEFDCNNPTRFDLLTKRQINEYFLWYSKNNNSNFTRQQHRKYARCKSKISDINNKTIVKKWMENSIKEYYEHDGVLSLTENWNNDAMWNKYADDEKGFCIGYNTKELFRHVGGGGRVEYCDEMPIILPEPFMGFEEAMRNRVFFKLRKWNFEEEYRTKMFWENPVLIENRQIKVPAQAYSKIILGNKISDINKNEIIQYVKEKIGDIEIVERKNAI